MSDPTGQRDDPGLATVKCRRRPSLSWRRSGEGAKAAGVIQLLDHLVFFFKKNICCTVFVGTKVTQRMDRIAAQTKTHLKIRSSFLNKMPKEKKKSFKQYRFHSPRSEMAKRTKYPHDRESSAQILCLLTNYYLAYVRKYHFEKNIYGYKHTNTHGIMSHPHDWRPLIHADSSLLSRLVNC